MLQGGQLQHVLNERGALSRLAGNAFLLQLVASYQDATHLYLLTELLQECIRGRVRSRVRARAIWRTYGRVTG